MLDAPNMAAKIAAAAGIDPTDGAGVLSQTLTVDTAADDTDYTFTLTFDAFIITFTVNSGSSATTSSIAAQFRDAISNDTNNDGPGILSDFVAEGGGAGATAIISSINASSESTPLFVAATTDVNMTMGPATFGSTLGDELENSTEGIVGDVLSVSLAADQDDYDPTGFKEATYLRVDSTAAVNRTITGLVPHHRTLLITNIIAANTLTLTHEDGASASANQFRLALGIDRVILSNETVLLVYDPVSQRWRDVS